MKKIILFFALLMLGTTISTAQKREDENSSFKGMFETKNRNYIEVCSVFFAGLYVQNDKPFVMEDLYVTLIDDEYSSESFVVNIYSAPAIDLNDRDVILDTETLQLLNSKPLFARGKVGGGEVKVDLSGENIVITGSYAIEFRPSQESLDAMEKVYDTYVKKRGVAVSSNGKFKKGVELCGPAFHAVESADINKCAILFLDDKCQIFTQNAASKDVQLFVPNLRYTKTTPSAELLASITSGSGGDSGGNGTDGGANRGNSDGVQGDDNRSNNGGDADKDSQSGGNSDGKSNETESDSNSGGTGSSDGNDRGTEGKDIDEGSDPNDGTNEDQSNGEGSGTDGKGRNGSSDNGVELGGVYWAKFNVSEQSGRFVGSEQEVGGYFTKVEAQSACPQGWRLPTKEEVEALAKASKYWPLNFSGRAASGSGWTFDFKGKYGLFFGPDAGNSATSKPSMTTNLFFPVTGYYESGKDKLTTPSEGFYWVTPSQSDEGSTDTYLLKFTYMTITPYDSKSGVEKMPVRCVRAVE